ncbi:MAG: hypothetical protein JNL98_34540, partial [Bryobacterales bacterium]|nr:hypothetical protein [Bryobacterales bacterium]
MDAEWYTYTAAQTDEPRFAHLLSLPLTEEVFGPEGLASKTEYQYDKRTLLAAEGNFSVSGHDASTYTTGKTERGNVTAVRRSTAGSAVLTTAMQYDVLGNPRRIMPPNLVASHAGYGESATLDSVDGAAILSYEDSCIPGMTGARLL